MSQTEPLTLYSAVNTGPEYLETFVAQIGISVPEQVVFAVDALLIEKILVFTMYFSSIKVAS